MLHTRATIIRVEDGEAVVRPTAGGGCSACNKQGSCGSGNLNNLLSARPPDFRVRDTTGARAGDEVRVVIPDGMLLRSAGILYALPLSLLFAGAFCGQYLSGGNTGADAGTAGGAGCGLVLGFVLARLLAVRQQKVASALPCVSSDTRGEGSTMP